MRLVKFGVSSKLVMLFLAFGALPMAAICIITFQACRIAVDFTGVQLRNVAVNIADKIDRNLFERYGDVQAFGLNRIIQDRAQWFRPVGDNTIARAMNQYIDTYDIYSLMILVDMNGRVIAVNDRDSEGRPIDTAFIMERNYRDSGWFRACTTDDFTRDMPFAAAENNQVNGTFVEDVHRDPDVQRAYPGDDGLSIGFSAPVRDEAGEVIGVWSNRSKFSNVKSIVVQAYRDLKPDFPSSELTILNSVGAIIVDYDPLARGDEAIRHDFGVLFALNLAQKGVSAAQAAVQGRTGFEWAVHARKKVMQAAGYAHLRGAMGFPGMNWSVLVRASESELVSAAGTREIKRNVLIAAAVSLASIVAVGLLVGRRFGRPLARISLDLGDAARQVNAAAAQVSSSAQGLAAGSSEQAASLQEAGASLTQLSERTRSNADGARRASEIAEQARTAAAAGDATMSRLNDAMTGINEAAGKISKIIKVIEGIAFQTNLLALNAAVEAARAGEHGRGFAVVADEVRGLAQRAANAARETTAMIEDSVQRTRDGSEVAIEVSESLATIVNQATDVSTLLESIARASSEQAEGVQQLNAAVAQIDRVTQQNVATAEESAAAAEELSAQSESVLSFSSSLSGFVSGERATSSGTAEGGA